MEKSLTKISMLYYIQSLEIYYPWNYTKEFHKLAQNCFLSPTIHFFIYNGTEQGENNAHMHGRPIRSKQVRISRSGLKANVE